MTGSIRIKHFIKLVVLTGISGILLYHYAQIKSFGIVFESRSHRCANCDEADSTFPGNARAYREQIDPQTYLTRNKGRSLLANSVGNSSEPDDDTNADVSIQKRYCFYGNEYNPFNSHLI